MEYANYGNLSDFIKYERVRNDTILIRTWFHQLIEGLAYLHKHDIAHMDLKL